jgi:hypothetical protein
MLDDGSAPSFDGAIVVLFARIDHDLVLMPAYGHPWYAQAVETKDSPAITRILRNG